MHRLISLLLLAIGVLVGACDDLPEDVVVGDAHPGPNDVGPCGPLPVVFCFEGAIGRTCGTSPVLQTCDGTNWSCPKGTVVPSDCRCRVGLPDAGEDGTTSAGDAGNPGDWCPRDLDAGSDTKHETGETGDVADTD